MTIFNMAAQSAMDLPGAQSCAVVDLESGTCLGRCSTNVNTNIGPACFINAQIMRSKMRLVRELSPGESIQDLMITLDNHYHLIRVLDNKGATPVLFLYLIVDRTTANLVMARRKLADIEQVFWRIPDIEKQVSDASFAAILRTPIASNFTTSDDFNVDNFDNDEPQDELPPFMRDEVVLKLLGMPSMSADLAMSGIYVK